MKRPWGRSEPRVGRVRVDLDLIEMRNGWVPIIYPELQASQLDRAFIERWLKVINRDAQIVADVSEIPDAA